MGEAGKAPSSTVSERACRPVSAERRGSRPQRRSGATALGRTGTPADGATQRPADDVDHLVDVLVGLAALRGGPDAALDVVLKDHDRQRVDGGPQRRGLLEDVDAVLLALDHPGNAADLALHPGEPADQSRLVLRIGMAEVVRRRVGRRSTLGLRHVGLLVVLVVRRICLFTRNDTPWEYRSRRGLRAARTAVRK